MRRKKELFSVRVSAESAGTKNWGADVSRAFGRKILEQSAR
jgi:hypothetical protein